MQKKTFNRERTDFQMEELLAIFCDTDDFCKEYEEYCTHHLLVSREEIIPQTRIYLSEIMTTVIYFHLSHYRTFKWYYKYYVEKILKPYFPKLVSYNRFVEIMRMAIVPMTLYLIGKRFGKCTGINFVDSTTLDVCDTHRVHCHKVFKGFADWGKGSMGWFYGFKLHLAINEQGEILSFCLTSGNVDDRNLKVMEHLTKKMYGKLFADRGYISEKLFTRLLKNNVTLITKIKKNMKNKLVKMNDKLLLRKRAVIESVNDFLKNICQIEHTRHRSVDNFLVNLIAGMIAYTFLPKKPSLIQHDRKALVQY